MVGPLLGLIANTVLLVTQPISMIRLLWQLCVRVVCFLTFPWFRFFKFFFHLYLDICLKLIVWAIAAISVPIQLLTALQREKQLEAHLHELQTQLEGLICINKDLEKRLNMVVEDHKRTKYLLVEVEEEQGKSIEKVHLLEIRLRAVEDENLRLRQMEERRLLKSDAVEHIESGGKEEDTEDVNRKHTSLLERENGNGSEAEDESWNSGRRGKILDNNLMDKKSNFRDSEKKFQQVDPLLETGKKKFPYSFSNKLKASDEMIYQWRGVALAQSAFSACLSLLVGMIAWKAEDPCLPLVIALFIVVGMSLKSVIQFFSRIENRPGSDAVALLSFNWFILGALASPTFPNIARLLAPLASEFGCQIASWFGFSLK